MSLPRLVLTCALVTGAIAGTPAVVDRVAVTVGNRAITTSHIDDEIRLTAFLNDEPPLFDAASRRAAAARLVERILLEKEMQITRFMPPATDDDLLTDLRTRFLNTEGYEAALKKAGITEAKLAAHLADQNRTLLFIDFRFRPAVSVSEAEARRFFDTEYPAFWAALHPDMPTPAYDTARDEVDRLLTDRKVDAEMDQWLQVARQQWRVVFHDEAFE